MRNTQESYSEFVKEAEFSKYMSEIGSLMCMMSKDQRKGGIGSC